MFKVGRCGCGPEDPLTSPEATTLDDLVLSHVPSGVWTGEASRLASERPAYVPPRSGRSPLGLLVLAFLVWRYA